MAMFLWLRCKFIHNHTHETQQTLSHCNNCENWSLNIFLDYYWEKGESRHQIVTLEKKWRANTNYPIFVVHKPFICHLDIPHLIHSCFSAAIFLNTNSSQTRMYERGGKHCGLEQTGSNCVVEHQLLVRKIAVVPEVLLVIGVLGR